MLQLGGGGGSGPPGNSGGGGGGGWGWHGSSGSEGSQALSRRPPQELFQIAAKLPLVTLMLASFAVTRKAYSKVGQRGTGGYRVGKMTVCSWCSCKVSRERSL
jgi:hypothetical protein